MAQHIPIEKMEGKRFRDIEKTIRGDFIRSRGLMKTSFKYKLIASEKNMEDIYITDMSIPKGIVYETDWGLFEVHTNNPTGNITDIYLVA